MNLCVHQRFYFPTRITVHRPRGMGAVSSSLASCLAAGNAGDSAPRALGEAAAVDGLDGDAPTRTRQERAATVIAAHVRRHLENRMAGKALVGQSVRIAASAESVPSVRRYDGCTGRVTLYDIATDSCHIDVGATTSSATLEDLEARASADRASLILAVDGFGLV